jgi:hypothetical protein
VDKEQRKVKKRERLGEGKETTQNTRTHSYKAKRIKNEKQQQQNFSRHLCCSEIFQDIFVAFYCSFPPSLSSGFPTLVLDTVQYISWFVQTSGSQEYKFSKPMNFLNIFIKAMNKKCRKKHGFTTFDTF